MMKSGLTWVFIFLACTLGVIVFWFDQSSPTPEMSKGERGLLFPHWEPYRVQSIDFFYATNRFVRIQKRGKHWDLNAPLHYPANEPLLEEIIRQVGELYADRHITGQELERYKSSLGDYGISAFHYSLILQHGAERIEIRLGNKTVGEDEVFFQLIGREGIFLGNAKLLNLIPKSESGWRDSRVVRLDKERVCQIDFKAPVPYGIDLRRRENESRRWDIYDPTPMRADAEKIEGLMDLFENWRVEKFVTDFPLRREERLDQYGLRYPKAQITFLSEPFEEVVERTGDKEKKETQLEKITVQFGNINQNNTEMAYIGLESDSMTNIVMAKSEFLNDLMKPWQSFVDPHLWNVFSNEVRSVIFTSLPAEEDETGSSFILEKNALSDHWQARGLEAGSLSGTNIYPVDEEVVQWLMNALCQTEITAVAKDLVTDYTPFGLKKPFQWIRVNRHGGVSDQQVNFARVNRGESVFIPDLEKKTDLETAEPKSKSKSQSEAFRYYIRRLENRADGIPEEMAVHAVSEESALKFPIEAFQLYPRNIMNFTTNDFVQITFTYQDRKAIIERDLVGGYKVVGYQGKLPEPILMLIDEFVYRLGEFRVDSWIYRGDKLPEEYEIKPDGRSLKIQYLNRGNIEDCELIFGEIWVAGTPIAVIEIDDKLWVFKFPLRIYDYYQDLLNVLMGRTYLGR